MRDLLIRGAIALAGEEEGRFDVLVSGEKIKKIESRIEAKPEYDIIEAGGKILVPGGIDAHTHLNIDVGGVVSCDDFYTGTLAAAWGGTTSIIDHPGFGPAGCPLDYQIKKYKSLAWGKAVIDYSFHGVIQHVDGSVLNLMETLLEEGITSYKIYLTYAYGLSDSCAYRVLKRAGELGIVTAVHPENDGIIGYLREEAKLAGRLETAMHPRTRPVECEAEAVGRIALFAKMAGSAPLYIVHLSNALGLDFIRRAREGGQRGIYVETCPQYLFLDESLYNLPDGEALKYMMCPPLRPKSDSEELWRSLNSGIDVIGTDHCAFSFKTQKILGKDDFTLCPCGAPGVEERMPLLFSEGFMKKRLSLRRFVELCCSNPAKIFGLYPQKGVIKEGSDADLVIFNPDEKRVLRGAELHSNAGYSVYEGMKLTGYPETVISRGEIIIDKNRCLANPGRGRFIRRKIG